MSGSEANGRTARGAVQYLETLMYKRLFLGLLAIVLAGQMACVDPKEGGATGDTALYFHSVESGTARIQVFLDAEAVFTGSGPATPGRTLTSDLLNKVSPLAWGGLALDSRRNLLYAVGENGTIVRISSLRGQTGAIPTNEIASFELSNTSTDRLSGGKFNQAALDPSTDTLYVAETSPSASQVWVIASASGRPNDATVPKVAVTLAGTDKGCTGLAVGRNSEVFGFFKEGGTVGFPTAYDGPRLRKGNSATFPSSDGTIIGPATLLKVYGSLACDTGGNELYVARHLSDASVTTGDPILVFTSGDFSQGLDKAPSRTMGDANQQANLRVIAHPGNKDWLGGLRSDAEVGLNTFYLWKKPSSGGAAVSRTLVQGAEIRGIAFDGNN